MHAVEPRLQHGIDVVDLAGLGLAQLLRRRLQLGEVVGVVAEEVVDDGLRRRGEQPVGHALAAELHHLLQRSAVAVVELQEVPDQHRRVVDGGETGSASCRERVLQKGSILAVAVYQKQKKKKT